MFRQARRNNLIRVIRHRINYGASEPISYIMDIFNSVGQLFEVGLCCRVFRIPIRSSNIYAENISYIEVFKANSI